MGGYLPGKELSKIQKGLLVNYLTDNTLLKKEYIDLIDKESKLPGYIENNYDGWESQPWYEAWLDNLPEKKKSDPFQGSVERRRVPMDPTSVKKSLNPHPMKPSDAETIAGALAILKSGLDKDEIDLVLCHSQVQDHPLPTNTSLVQHKLKLKNAGAYAVDSCCSTFVTMVEIASALVKTGIKKNVLIINSIIDTMITDKSDYYSVNTGDAAFGAIISESDMDHGYLGSASTSHGSRHDGVIFQRRQPHLHLNSGGGATHEQDFVTFYDKEACREIGANAVPDLLNVIQMVEEKTKISVSDIDFFITHQPVAWAGDVWREALNVPKEKFYYSFEKYGNIATCSVAVNLMEAIENELIKENDTVLLASPGAGENHIALFQKVDPRLIQNIQTFASNKILEKELTYNN